MRAVTVLWTVCLVRICNAGWPLGAENPGYDKIPLGTEIHSSGQSADVQEDNACVSETLDPKVLDLANPDSSFSRSVETDIKGVPAKVFLIHPTATITEVKNDDESTVWKAPYGEACTYCIAFLRDGHPAMIAVGIKDSSGRYMEYYKFKDEAWQRSRRNFVSKINALRVGTATPDRVSLDLSSDADTENCKVVKEDKNGVSTHIYSTKSGHSIKNVMDGDVEVWRDSCREMCFLCRVLSRENYTLIELNIWRNELFANKFFMMSYFEKVEGKWSKVSPGKVDGKLADMMATTPPRRSPNLREWTTIWIP